MIVSKKQPAYQDTRELLFSRAFIPNFQSSIFNFQSRQFRYLLLVMMLFPVICSSQNFNTQATADFRLVNEAYTKSQRLQMNVGYTLFPNYVSTVPFEKQNGVFMKQGNSTYSSLLGIVSLRNSKVSLTLDSSEHTIIVTDPPTKNEQNPSLVNLDSLMKICSSVEYTDLGKLKFYKLKFDRTPFFEYNAIDVYINAQTHFLDRLTLYFRAEVDLDAEEGEFTSDRPRLEIVYSSITTNPAFSGDTFSESRFVQLSGKKISCASAYATYRLVNNKLK